MAVPSAVKARQVREAAALAAQGIDPDGPPQAVQHEPFSAPDADAVQTPSTAAAEQSVADLQSEIAALKQKISTHDGRVSATAQDNEQLKKTLDAVQANREFLESKLTEAVEQLNKAQADLQELRSKSTTEAADGVLSQLEKTRDLTPQEEAEFGKESVEFVQLLARKEIASALKPLLAEMKTLREALGRLTEIDRKLPQLEQSVQLTAKERALAQQEKWVTDEIIPQFSDFREVRKSKEWLDYLQSKTQTGQTVGQFLAHQYQLNNPAGARTIIKVFYDRRESKPNLDSLATPAKVATDTGTQQNREAKPRLKESDYRAKLTLFTQRRLPKADWEAYKLMFAEAQREGRVDFGQ